MNTIMESTSESVKVKLQSLVSYLYPVTKGFESMAVDIECANFITAIFILSVEARQYIAPLLVVLKAGVNLNTTGPAAGFNE